MPSDDEELLERWRAGDASAGSALFDAYYEGVARFFVNKVDDDAASDLVQATFLACVEGRERLREDASFRSYLFGVAHNLLRKHYEKRRVAGAPVDVSEQSVADLAPTASELLRVGESQRLLLEALRRVPLECQEVLELHYWEQLSTSEIAGALDVPEGTVKSRLQRGRRLLEEKLERLAASKELFATTLTNLDRWAADLKDRLAPSRGDA